MSSLIPSNIGRYVGFEQNPTPTLTCGACAKEVDRVFRYQTRVNGNPKMNRYCQGCLESQGHHSVAFRANPVGRSVVSPLLVSQPSNRLDPRRVAQEQAESRSCFGNLMRRIQRAFANCLRCLTMCMPCCRPLRNRATRIN